MDPTINASIAKMYATEAAFEIASEAVQIAGGYGYTRMFPFEKILRDTRVLMIYEGTSEIQRVIIAGHTLGNYKPAMPPLEDLAIMRGEGTGKLFTDEMKGKTAWRCRMCGYVHYGDTPPDECPSCFFPSTAFKKVWPA
jgi:acyl-CoA dehydrogenase